MTSDTITRDIVINASAETVYDVVSRPEHIANWFSDEAELEPIPGRRGVLTFRMGDRRTEESVIEVTVVSADRPQAALRHRFRDRSRRPSRHQRRRHPGQSFTPGAPT